MSGKRVFIATCPTIDDEMDARVAKHQQERSSREWDTIEEPTNLCDTIRAHPEYGVYLIDCITLWINNLLYEAQKCDTILSEENITSECERLIKEIKDLTGCIVIVTNEVGMGIIPGDEITRKYRDLVGRANQVLAHAADKVIMISCGIPLTLKD